MYTVTISSFRVPIQSGKPWKMKVRLQNLEKSWNFVIFNEHPKENGITSKNSRPHTSWFLFRGWNNSVSSKLLKVQFVFKWNSSSLHILILKKLEVTLKIMKNTYILINRGKMWRISGILSVQANSMPANISRTAICSHSINHHISLILIFTARKRSLGKVIFSQVCVKNSVHRGGCLLWGVPAPGGRSAPGEGVPALGGGGLLLGRVCLLLGGSAPGGRCLVETPPTATAVGSTHPTGMHSCFSY